MTTNRDILDLLQRLAPPALAEDWDNNGLLCGRLDAPVTRVLVALDPFLPAAEEAAALGAQLLVTHHPLIFRPAKAVTDETAVGRTLLWLIEHGIAAMNAHTSLDYAAGGVTDALAAALGLEEVAIPAADSPVLWRMGLVPRQPVGHYAALVKAKLGANGVRYADAGHPVRRVAVCGGAGMDCLTAAAEAGCDTLVTGDVKYNGFWDAVDLGLNVIDAGHFPTEQPVCAVLARAIAGAFPEVAVSVSRRHGDIVQFG